MRLHLQQSEPATRVHVPPLLCSSRTRPAQSPGRSPRAVQRGSRPPPVACSVRIYQPQSPVLCTHGLPWSPHAGPLRLRCCLLMSLYVVNRETWVRECLESSGRSGFWASSDVKAALLVCSIPFLDLHRLPVFLLITRYIQFGRFFLNQGTRTWWGYWALTVGCRIVWPAFPWESSCLHCICYFDQVITYLLFTFQHLIYPRLQIVACGKDWIPRLNVSHL